jgi:hypothetical protein
VIDGYAFATIDTLARFAVAVSYTGFDFCFGVDYVVFVEFDHGGDSFFPLTVCVLCVVGGQESTLNND